MPAAAVASATALAKRSGARSSWWPYIPMPRPVDPLQRIFWRELMIVGARVYERTDFDAAIELIGSGVVPTSELITRVVPFSPRPVVGLGRPGTGRQGHEGPRRCASGTARAGPRVTSMFDLTGRLAVVTGAKVAASGTPWLKLSLLRVPTSSESAPRSKRPGAPSVRLVPASGGPSRRTAADFGRP